MTKVVKQWSSQAMGRLRDCLDNTDWSVFREPCHDLDEYTDVVTPYYKPWFSREIKTIMEK